MSDKFPIDVLSVKKYLKKGSDAQLARIGHVNALAEDLDANKLALEAEIEFVEASVTATNLVVASVVEQLDSITDNVYADNAAALAGSLEVGQLYSTATGEIRVVVAP